MILRPEGHCNRVSYPTSGGITKWHFCEPYFSGQGAFTKDLGENPVGHSDVQKAQFQTVVTAHRYKPLRDLQDGNEKTTKTFSIVLSDLPLGYNEGHLQHTAMHRPI